MSWLRAGPGSIASGALFPRHWLRSPRFSRASTRSITASIATASLDQRGARAYRSYSTNPVMCARPSYRATASAPDSDWIAALPTTMRSSRSRSGCLRIASSERAPRRPTPRSLGCEAAAVSSPGSRWCTTSIRTGRTRPLRPSIRKAAESIRVSRDRSARSWRLAVASARRAKPIPPCTGCTSSTRARSVMSITRSGASSTGSKRCRRRRTLTSS